MRTLLLIVTCISAAIISCAGDDSPSPNTDLGPELIHAIAEYDIEYQTRAKTIAQDQMQHWPDESYVRWRPVRIEPSVVLNHDFLKAGAMPASLSLSPFPDTRIYARQTKYTAFEHINQALWEGTIPNSDHGTVRVTIVGMDEGTAFVINVWNPPNTYHIAASDSLDVYVAIEGHVSDNTNIKWAPNN